ncbi:MAG: hypothetical protein ABFS34_09140 [Gemmatimonadota bacterium]
MAHSNNAELPYRRLDGVPRPVLLMGLGAAVVGLIALAAGLMRGDGRAWQAYLFNWLFWFGVAQGAVVFSAVTVITRSQWARPVRRLALSFVAFLPIGFVLFLPLLLAGEHIFPWTHEMYHDGLERWLNEGFVSIRNVLALGVMVGLSLAYARITLRPDVGMRPEDATTGVRGWVVSGWRGQEEEERRAHRKLARLGPILGMVYAASMSIVAWDYVMSLEAGWFSTLLGPYYFMAAFLGGIAATTVLAVIYRSKLGLEDVIRTPHFHDLGKLTFAFCVFWAYLFWSQYIVIWYGQLPWEQTFLVHRLTAPYTALSVAVLGLLFLAPFFALLSVAAKKKPSFLATVASLILFGLWLERYTLVYPSLYPGADGVPFGWVEIGVTLLFAGLFVLSLAAFAAKFPIFQVWEPMVDPHEFDDPYFPPRERAVEA